LKGEGVDVVENRGKKPEADINKKVKQALGESSASVFFSVH